MPWLPPEALSECTARGAKYCELGITVEMRFEFHLKFYLRKKKFKVKVKTLEIKTTLTCWRQHLAKSDCLLASRSSVSHAP